MSFASTLYLCPVLDLLLMDIPMRWRAEIRLGLQEALVNASKHGNNLDPSKTVLVRYSIVNGQYWWIISDQGSGFQPTPNCDRHPDDCNKQDVQEVGECGRGLFILHQIFDQVCWNSEGNELTLCKHIKHEYRLPLLS